MLAEIRGKLSHESTTPADRLEDTLTDAVFGTLRYLPRHVLGEFLVEAFGIAFSAAELNSAAFTFWPSFLSGTEPDVVLEVGGVMIIVEAKYESPFSHGQLEREWRDGRGDANARRLRGPWIVAVTSHAGEPRELENARHSLATDEEFLRSGLDADASVRWLSWRRIASIVEREKGILATHERALVEDLLALMDKRGVRHMFEGFAMEDYWLLTSAQRAAGERLYPALARLVQDLTAIVSEDGLVYSNSSPNAIGHWQSLQFTQSAAWTRAYFVAPYWCPAWSKPPKDTMAALFVIFNFWTPQIEVGYFLQPANAAARPAWIAAATDLAAALQSLPEEMEVVTDAGGWTRTAEVRQPNEVDGAWIRTIVSRGAHLRFHRAVSPQSIRGVGPLRDMLVAARDLVAERPLLVELVSDDANVSTTPDETGLV